MPVADAAGCPSGDESVQRHGTACLCCHSDEFGVAGSIDPMGSPVARVLVTDSEGSTADLVPNSFGNFFRHFTMTPPLRASVYAQDGRAVTMTADAPSADCNGCHVTGGLAPPIHGP